MCLPLMEGVLPPAALRDPAHPSRWARTPHTAPAGMLGDSVRRGLQARRVRGRLSVRPTGLGGAGGGDVDCGGGKGTIIRRSAIEAHESVQVIRSALLIFADLGELRARMIPCGVLAHAQVDGDEKAQPDREPTPQLGAVPLPDRLSLIVVAVRAQCLPDQRIVRGVVVRATTRATALPQPRGSIGSARPRLGTGRSRSGRNPERRSGQREEHERVSGDALRALLSPPETPAERRCHMSPWYSWEHEGQRETRRLPQRM